MSRSAVRRFRQRELNHEMRTGASLKRNRALELAGEHSDQPQPEREDQMGTDPNLCTCQEAATVLKELTPMHPGRYIMLCAAAETEAEPLHHQVSVHCVYNPERRQQICCDLVTLQAKSGFMEELYGLTLSLLVSDLPVEFWWLGDLPLTSPIFRKLAADADRVWVDSSRFARPPEALALLASSWERTFPGTVLADLNWVRFARWRHLIAELFDGEWTPYLWQIRELTIEYGEGRPPTRGFLLTCWMAARLGWRYGGGPLAEFPERIEFESDHGPVTVVIRSVAVEDQGRDRLYAIRIRT